MGQQKTVLPKHEPLITPLRLTNLICAAKNNNAVVPEWADAALKLLKPLPPMPTSFQFYMVRNSRKRTYRTASARAEARAA